MCRVRADKLENPVLRTGLEFGVRIIFVVHGQSLFTHNFSEGQPCLQVNTGVQAIELMESLWSAVTDHKD